MLKFKHLIAASALLIGCVTAAQGEQKAPYQRSLSGHESMSLTKSINTRPHHQRSEGIVMRSPATRKAAAAISVPFTHSLGKDEKTADTYTVIDANNDTKTWKAGGFTTYSVCMKPTATDVTAMDDWMISPAIALEAGVEYELSIDTRYVLSSGSLDKLDVMLGSDVTAASMTQTIANIEAKSKDWVNSTAKFTVAASGSYHIGLHAVSDKATSGNLGVCNLSVTSSADTPGKVDPPAAGTLTYQVYPGGELKAHVVYTAPTKTVSGADLEKIAKVQIINRWYEKFDYTDVTPGQVIELDVDLFSGSANNRLQATAYVLDDDGNEVAGEEVLVTGIMAGYDYPLAPENIKATLSADRKKVTVTWDAVSEVGEAGGYVPVDKVKYYLFDAFGSYTDPALAETAATSYTFDYSDVTEQDFIAYQVTAGYDTDDYSYYSTEGVSNILTYGPAEVMPFKESFADAYYESVWVTDLGSSKNVHVGTVDDTTLQTNADDPDAEPVYLTSQDGDNGFFYFLPMEKDDMYGMMSLAVDLSEAVNPVLEFWAQGKGSVIDAMVGPTIAEMKPVKTFDFKEQPTDGWTRFAVPLNDFIDAGAINFELRMRAIHNDDEHTWSLPIDNIRVRDIVPSNLALSALNAPAAAPAGENVTLTARVENLGSDSSAATTALLYRDGAKVAEAEVPALQPNDVAVVTLTDLITLADDDVITYKVEVVNATDAKPADNSAEVKVNVAFPAHPEVSGLTATPGDNNINLSWDAVSIDGLTTPEVVKDGFEGDAYTDFEYNNPGEWLTMDLDGAVNYTFLKDVNNPYRNVPMAFQVFNPSTSGMPDEYRIDCEPHSGDRLLVGWSCDSYNLNLLISPRLSGNAQKVTFWAKSFTSAYGETFTPYVSTGGNTIADFKRFDNLKGELTNGEVPEVWTQYTMELPEGTTYFAIMHDSYDTYALYLDDFEFETAPVIPADTRHLGYNLYRDGVLLNDSPIEATSYVDEPATEAGNYHYSYRVSAAYNNAESRHSAPAEVDLVHTGIENVAVDSLLDDINATYYDMQGRRVNAKRLAPGIYLRDSGASARKVIVK